MGEGGFVMAEVSHRHWSHFDDFTYSKSLQNPVCHRGTWNVYSFQHLHDSLWAEGLRPNYLEQCNRFLPMKRIVNQKNQNKLYYVSEVRMTDLLGRDTRDAHAHVLHNTICWKVVPRPKHKMFLYSELALKTWDENVVVRMYKACLAVSDSKQMDKDLVNLSLVSELAIVKLILCMTTQKYWSMRLIDYQNLFTDDE